MSESRLHGIEILHWAISSGDFMAISEHKLASGRLSLTMTRFQDKKKLVKFIVIKD